MKKHIKGVAGKRRQIHRTDKQKTAIVNRFNKAGLTVSAHCRNEGIYESQFYSWRNKYSSGELSDALKADFVQVIPQVQVSHLEIVLPNGIQIKTAGTMPDFMVVKSLMDL